MRIVPPIRPIRDGKILDANLINHMIQRTEYGAELLARYKMVAGTNMFVEQAGNGLGISYLTALAGGAGNPVGSGSAGTGSGGAGTGTGGAGTGSGGSGTPQPVAQPYRLVGQTVRSGFVYDGVTLTKIMYPGSYVTRVNAIDGNNMVGTYEMTLGGQVNGFLYNGSTYTAINYVLNGSIRPTNPLGISGNTIVGDYDDNVGQPRGFVYNGSTFSTLTFPVFIGGFDRFFIAFATGIYQNKIIGTYFTTDGRGPIGCIVIGGGLSASLDFAKVVVPRAIYGNTIVGMYGPISPGNRAFIYNGSVRDFVYPGSSGTTLLGIYKNYVVGRYDGGSFLYDGSTFTDISTTIDGQSISVNGIG